MVFLRRRYYIWLFKAYVKRWKKTIGFSILIGSILFFLLLVSFKFYLQPLLDKKIIKIGVMGSYALNELPEVIVEQISYGLTSVEKNGEVKPSAALRWEIMDNGKKYVLHIKKGQRFHNGQELTAKNISYNFQDVKKKSLDLYTVSFELKDPYSPFLATLSKPILNQNLQGLGEYHIKTYELNGNYLKSLTLENVNDYNQKRVYYFYPTEKALKTAFAIGEIDQAFGLSNLNLDEIDLSKLKNIKVTKSTNYTKLVTIFYNTKDKYLSNKKLRQSLQFSLVENFKAGERAYSCIPPNSVFYSKPLNAILDLGLAKTYLSSANEDYSQVTFEISTTKEFEPVVKTIQANWKKLGIKTIIKILDGVPSDFQIFVYQFKVPSDPDQYAIWHSGQKNNIMQYKSDRIDKLLENGRISSNQTDRVKIYADYQKYLSDDAPASFLYFPYEYSIVRNLNSF